VLQHALYDDTDIAKQRGGIAARMAQDARDDDHWMKIDSLGRRNPCGKAGRKNDAGELLCNYMDDDGKFCMEPRWMSPRGNMKYIDRFCRLHVKMRNKKLYEARKKRKG
jgi:hypothetical protein